MPNTRYRKGKLYAADMAMYSRQMAADNSREVSRLKRNLIRCLREQIVIDKSSVSRTIKRGERRLQRCLRYGAEAYLRSMDDL